MTEVSAESNKANGFVEHKPPSLVLQGSSPEHSADQAVQFLGCWSIGGNIGKKTDLIKQLNQLSHKKDHILWDLSNISLLDGAGAILIWRAWGQQLPPYVKLNDSVKASFDRLAQIRLGLDHSIPFDLLRPIERLGKLFISGWKNFLEMIVLIGTLGIQTVRLARLPRKIPWREVSANIYRAGFLALFICALVGYTIGIALSYLLSQQLQNFGAGSFIVNILGIGITREMGPLIAAILIAGRSGSSMTAQIGVMRITEEIAALSVMGIPPALRLVFPKVMALVIVTPFIVFWTSVTGILGGLLASNWILDIGLPEFIATVPRDLLFQNLIIALVKGATFGLLIGIIACYFGLKVKPNTESLSQETTASVVTSITVVMLMDALFAIMLSSVGI